jgi:hypothetical protein
VRNRKAIRFFIPTPQAPQHEKPPREFVVSLRPDCGLDTNRLCSNDPADELRSHRDIDWNNAAMWGGEAVIGAA